MPASKPGTQETIVKAMPVLTAIAAVAYAAAAYFLLLTPALSKVVSGGSLDVGPLQQEVAGLESYGASIDSATEGYRKLNADHKERVSRMVPSDPAVHDLMVQMDSIAAKHQLALVSVDAAVDDKAPAPPGAKVVRGSANLSGGDYATFKAFLAELETTLRITDVQSVVFGAGSGSYSVVLRAYFVP